MRNQSTKLGLIAALLVVLAGAESGAGASSPARPNGQSQPLFQLPGASQQQQVSPAASVSAAIQQQQQQPGGVLVAGNQHQAVASAPRVAETNTIITTTSNNNNNIPEQLVGKQASGLGQAAPKHGPSSSMEQGELTTELLRNSRRRLVAQQAGSARLAPQPLARQTGARVQGP